MEKVKTHCKEENKYIHTYILSFRVLVRICWEHTYITNVHIKRATTWEEIDDWLNIWNAHIKEKA